MQGVGCFLIGWVNTGFARSVPSLEVCFTVLKHALADPNEEMSCHFRLSEMKISISETIFGYLNSWLNWVTITSLSSEIKVNSE